MRLMANLLMRGDVTNEYDPKSDTSLGQRTMQQQPSWHGLTRVGDTDGPAQTKPSGVISAAFDAARHIKPPARREVSDCSSVE